MFAVTHPANELFRLLPASAKSPSQVIAFAQLLRLIGMDQFAIWASLEAKPGKESEVEEFLKSARALVEKEPATTTWYALKIGPSKYGIFDTFADEKGRQAHLNGEVAKALFAKAKDLFAKEPEIDKPTILAAKV